jgi:uncharacterized protein YigE (DUF2233 family)
VFIRVHPWLKLLINRSMLKILLLPIAVLLIAHRSDAVEFTNALIAGKRAVVCRVNVKTERLELFLTNDAGAYFKTFEAVDRSLRARRRTLTFGINAGMFHADGSPVGLFVANGTQLHSLNTADGQGNFFLKPNGVFLVATSGAHVIESSEYPGWLDREREQPLLATQSGPLLVRNGRLHPEIRASSTSRYVRNGVGIPTPEIALFVITEEPVTFHELATFFRDQLKCPDALYLDGAICSLHSVQLKRSDKRSDLGPILGVTERGQ